jgi:hypothetical protein
VKRLFSVLPLLPWLTAAALVLAATSFTFLQTDDFCTFGRVTVRFDGNPLADVANLYWYWTGRYSASFLVALVASSSLAVPVSFAYSIALALLVLLFGWACVEASRLLDTAAGRVNPAWALVAFCSTLVMMPSKLEQFLWLTGAAVYFAGASLTLVLVRLLATPQAPIRHHREVWICTLIALVTGFNEFLALTTGTALVVSMLRDRAWSQQWRKHFSRMAVFALAFSATILAPGNFARDAGSTVVRRQLGPATHQAAMDLSQFVLSFFDANLEAILYGAAGAVAAGLLSPKDGARTRELWPWALVLLGTFPAHLWLFSFLTGEATPSRVINQAFSLSFVVLCFGFAAAGQAAAAWFPTRHRIPVATLLLALSGLGLLTSDPFITFARTVHRYAPLWQAQQLERHAGLMALSGSRDPVYVRPFAVGDTSPPVFRGGDVGSDPADWVNRCVADYYRVDSIILMRRIDN